MPRLRLVPLAAACALIATTPADAKGRSCRHPPPKALLAKTRLVRVFHLRDGTYFACARRRIAPPVVLGYDADEERSSEAVRLVTAAGAFVAYEHDYLDVGPVERAVTVWDVVRRKQRWHIPTGVADPARCVVTTGTGELSDLVLKPTGAVAWITRDDKCAKAPGSEVHRADRRGTTLLMTDPAVRAGSLSLHGSTVSWLVGSSARTTDLR